METTLNWFFYVVIKCETFKLEIRPTIIKHKYLTLLYRNGIQLGLECDETLKVIGRAILKDLTTVSKKIKLKRQGLRI